MIRKILLFFAISLLYSAKRYLDPNKKAREILHEKSFNKFNQKLDDFLSNYDEDLEEVTKHKRKHHVRPKRRLKIKKIQVEESKPRKLPLPGAPAPGSFIFATVPRQEAGIQNAQVVINTMGRPDVEHYPDGRPISSYSPDNGAARYVTGRPNVYGPNRIL